MLPLIRIKKIRHLIRISFKNIFLDKIIFFKEMIHSPRSIGAAIPSSQYLARSMAEHIPKSSNGFVVELGAGTGVITKQILSSGIDPKRLILIEISPQLSMYLRKTFPNIIVIEGSAENLEHILNEKKHNIDAIVSSLPLKSLPKNVANNILESIYKVISYRSVYIQFTYKLFKNKKPHNGNLKHICSTIVWKNFPPASVQVMKKMRIHS